MSANQYKPKPVSKTYLSASGHVMTVDPVWSNHSGWHMIYAYAYHADSCPCNTSEDGPYNVEEYAGESE